MQPPAIFDRATRQRRRDRAQRIGDDFLRGLLVDELLERLDAVKRPFATALDLGTADGRLGDALAARGIAVTRVDAGPRYAAAADGAVADEDRLPFAANRFDLVMSAGGLDQVDDLPGALILARRALAPGGLFLAAFPGAGSLPMLRRAIAAADEDGPAAPRFHPMVDVRGAGDLLGRAGFAEPVADAFGIDLRYADLFRLVADLRAAAATNMLVERARSGLTRQRLARAAAQFAGMADPDGRTREHIEILVLTGWAPSAKETADQQTGAQAPKQPLVPDWGEGVEGQGAVHPQPEAR